MPWKWLLTIETGSPSYPTLLLFAIEVTCRDMARANDFGGREWHHFPSVHRSIISPTVDSVRAIMISAAQEVGVNTEGKEANAR